jgi:hypothetical protein
MVHSEISVKISTKNICGKYLKERNKIDYLEEAVVCLTVYRTGAVGRANKSLLV